MYDNGGSDRAQRMVEAIPIGEEIVKYAVRMNFGTRSNSKYATDMVEKYISWGSGPRASQFMVALLAQGHLCKVVLMSQLMT